MAEIQTDIHQSLIEKAIKGNASAQRKLYDLYSKAMYNICKRMMNSTQEAEDMLQESFIEAFKRLESFRFESTFGAWLKKICINKCINELKRRKVPIEYKEQIYKYDKADNDMYDDSDIELTIDKVKHAMGLLPDGYRLVFSLYLLEGYDHEEISEILGISESTSKTQLMRAKKKLVEIIKVGQSGFAINN